MQEKIVKVIEVQEEKILFQCSMEEIQSAYDYAASLEAMGLEIKILAPSAPETLALSLGSNNEDLEKLKNAIEFEVSEHDLEGCASSGCMSFRPRD